MKKLLILAYDFPPYVSVGGLRPYAWYKYLKEYEVYPVVITRQWSNSYGDERDYIAPSESEKVVIEETEYGTIVKTPYKPNLANRILLKYGKSKFRIVRKIVSAYYEFAQFIFFLGPKSCIYRGVKQYLRYNKVDVLIATGEPFILFKYASAFSKKYNIPWIADYRDPWSQSEGRSENIILRKWNYFFEKKFVSSASQIITVSEFVRFQIEKLIKDKPFSILPNGYNPDAIEKVKEIKQNSDVFSFAFVGTIYQWHPYESVLNQFNLFAKRNPSFQFRLNFFGINIPNEIENLVNTEYLYLKDKVNVYPKLPNEELLQKLAAHHVMLLFNHYSMMGTKIYDYMALKRQILLCYSNDEEAEILKNKYYPCGETEGLSTHLQEDLIKETNSGIVVENAVHLQQMITKLYTEFSFKGFIECQSHDIERFSRKKRTQELADIIDKI